MDSPYERGLAALDAGHLEQAIAAFDEALDSAAAAIAHGLPLAERAIDSGAAADVLQRWAALSQRRPMTRRRL